VTKNRALRSRIINHFVQSNLVQLNDKIIVAVSGGMDSMFLLSMLIEIQKELKIELVVGHINHNIRPNSEDDEKFVIEQGKNVQIPVIVKHLNFNDKKPSENTEAWARENRYEQLELIRKEHNFDKIATGHHSNDQIETVVQRISEKSGIGGLRGIHPQRGYVIRPILTISKSDIDKFVSDFRIEYIDDETNRNIKISRNYLRHKIIPLWESLYPNLGDSIQTICEYAVEDNSIINYFIEKLENEIVTDDRDMLSNKIIKRIDCASFEKLPQAVKVLLIKNIVGKYPWRKNQWNEIDKIIKSAKVGKVYSFDDFELLKDRQDWIIRHKLKVKQKLITVRLNESVQFGDIIFLIKEVENGSITENPNHEIISGDRIINSELVLRLWQDGDSFQPLGMIGNKKVSDFLIDEKVNQFEKKNQLVLTANEEIVWVCGHRISDTAKIKDNTKRFLELSIKANVG